jgi:ATP-dependent DNA helicase PIF1
LNINYKPVTIQGEIKFCFEAKSWKSVIKNTYELTKPFRQNDDVFVNILNEIRIGKLSDENLKILNKCERDLKFNDG